MFITSDVTIVKPFICLSWSYSESTNTICLSYPLSQSLPLPFLSHAPTINVFISKLPLVLQRHSQGTQLSLQESKSSHTPPSALHFSLFYLHFIIYFSLRALSLFHFLCFEYIYSNLTVFNSCLCFPQCSKTGSEINRKARPNLTLMLNTSSQRQFLLSPGLHFLPLSTITLSSSLRMLAEWSRCKWQTTFISALSFQPWFPTLVTQLFDQGIL